MALVSMLSVPALVFAASLPGPLLCDRGAPEPRSFHSRGFGFVAEVFPGESRNNERPEPWVYMYEVGYSGTGWEVDARHRWSAALPHSDFLNEAVVSMQGHLVTLDDYDDPGAHHAVVVFSGLGERLADYGLAELLTAEEILNTERSDCGVHWRRGARYYFLLDVVPRLYVALLGGEILEFDLQSGRMSRGEISTFPDLQRVVERPFPNEEAEVWPTSLRFSSITDGIGVG